ncbi:MAG: histidine kinase dimerization/phospho-acceptor domain-containing protein, partial [Myxococcota bacterium]
MSSRLLPGTEFLSLERLEAIASTLEELAQSFADSADASSNLVEQAGHLRRQAEQIELHLRSEALLAAISSRLLNVPLASLEAGLHESLSELGRGAGVQRAYVFLLSDDGSVLADAYEWVEDGVVAHDFDTFRGVPVTAFPWSMEQFRRGETVIVSEPEALPEEAAPERGACEALTIASYVNMPLLLDQQVLGWLGFDSVGSSKAWTVSELKLMELARDVITSAIQRKRREELVFRQRELKQRVTSMGILAAGLAHEINNPLSFVAGNISFLDEVLTAVTVSDGRVLSDVRQTLKDCHEGTQRVQRIVGDLRGLANGEDSEVTSVDVEDVINSTLRMASNQIHHRARLLRNYAGVPPVMANTSQLGQLLLNLVLNAAGAIPEGHTPDNRIEVKAYGEGERVIIEIRDTGSGIP